MSVQAGIWNFSGERVNRDSLTRLSEGLAGQVADGETTYVEQTLGMLYRPFHTTVEAAVETQPYVSVSGIVGTWDGRLDNRTELICQLNGKPTDYTTDIAIAMGAFEKWGIDTFRRLLGDWAIAIWHPRNKELLLARDYIGAKPIFYHPTPSGVTWCTQLAPLALRAGQLTLSDEYIANYLTLRPEAHLTPYREIHSVPAGAFVSIQPQRVYIQPYWTFIPQPTLHYRSDGEYEEQFRHLFRQAVLRRLRSQTPVLADLSGGLDSSSIVCMADDILAENHAAPSLHTFSYSFPDEPEADDFAYFTKVEAKRGQRGHHADLFGTGDSFALDYQSFTAIPGFGGRREVQAARLDVIRSGHYRVTLSGLGGDELMGQALDPRVAIADMIMQRRWKQCLKDVTTWSLLFRRPWIQVFLETFLLLLPAPLRSRLAGEITDDGWITEVFARTHKLSRRALQAIEGPWLWAPRSRDLLQSYVGLAGRLTNVFPSYDEKRYPYLDRDLFEFLNVLPVDQLLRPGDRRSLMRRALKDILPPEILSRRTKQGEGRCYVVTINKHWDRLMNVFNDPLTSHLGYIESCPFKTALRKTKSGDISKHPVMFQNGISLELWLRHQIAHNVISLGVRGSFSRLDTRSVLMSEHVT